MIDDDTVHTVVLHTDLSEDDNHDIAVKKLVALVDSTICAMISSHDNLCPSCALVSTILLLVARLQEGTDKNAYAVVKDEIDRLQARMELMEGSTKGMQSTARH